MWKRAILHADLDAFYAAVEQRDDPSLAGRPVAVGGGIILAASYEAKRFGVTTPLNEREARRRCPPLVVVAPRMDAYAEASRAVFEVFARTSPRVEPISIDEAFLDVTGLQRLIGPPTQVAETLRSEVRHQVGLPISVGVASTKHLAKVASRAAKPDGCVVVEPGSELDFLHPLPLSALWGVGAKTASRLEAVGLRTVADVAAVDPATLTTVVGAAAGRHLRALATNADPRPVVGGRRNRSIGSQRSFPSGLIGGDGHRRRDRPVREQADSVLLAVSDGVANRLRGSSQLARTVTVRLRFADFTTATRSRTLPHPTDSTDLIHHTASALLETAWPIIEERGLTRVGVAVSKLEPDSAVQLSLPLDPSDRGCEIDRAIDAARTRFGYGAVKRARLVGADSDYGWSRQHGGPATRA